MENFAQLSQPWLFYHPSSQEKQLLQKSCKILLKNTSCKILATVLQHFVISCKNFARVVSLAKNAIFARILQDLGRILQDLARNKLSLNTLRSDNLCFSPKSKHNQPLEVKFDEPYTC